MNTIFFDLETSDLNFAGQILNYAFFEVDDQWNVVSETKGNVKISKLQLPAPEAILANKIDVIEHQNSCSINETEATLQIYNLINRSISSQDFTKLIGYNSNSFDVPYLRTSMIRNGLNPYFGGNLHYGDLLHVVKKLSLTDESFRKRLRKKDDGRAILTLESVCKSFGILKDDEVQKHESEFDVLLTIKLAKFIFDNYGIDVRTYDSYEVEKRPTSFDCVKFVSDIDSKNFSSEDYSYYTLLEQNRTQSLWINLKLFDDGLDKKSITWFNKNTSQLLVDEYLVDDEFRSRSQKARDSLSHINLKNFWPDVNCDIEQHIYLLPIGEIQSLHNAIWSNDKFLLKRNKNKYANILYLRFLCNAINSDETDKIIHKYAMYRYGGKMKINKSDIDSTYEEGVYNKSFHRTYKELLTAIDDNCVDEESTYLMKRLKSFYEKSVIFQLSGTELMNLPERV